MLYHYILTLKRDGAAETYAGTSDVGPGASSFAVYAGIFADCSALFARSTGRQGSPLVDFFFLQPDQLSRH